MSISKKTASILISSNKAELVDMRVIGKWVYGILSCEDGWERKYRIRRAI